MEDRHSVFDVSYFQGVGHTPWPEEAIYLSEQKVGRFGRKKEMFMMLADAGGCGDMSGVICESLVRSAAEHFERRKRHLPQRVVDTVMSDMLERVWAEYTYWELLTNTPVAAGVAAALVQGDKMHCVTTEGMGVYLWRDEKIQQLNSRFVDSIPEAGSVPRVFSVELRRDDWVLLVSRTVGKMLSTDEAQRLIEENCTETAERIGQAIYDRKRNRKKGYAGIVFRANCK